MAERFNVLKLVSGCSNWLRGSLMVLALAASGSALALPDIVVNVTESADPIVAGINETYTITLNNNSSSDGATGVILNLTLPAGATFVSATPPLGDSCVNNGGSPVSVTCSLNAIGTNASHQVVLVMTPMTSGTNTLTITTTTNEGDANNTNNNINIQTTVTKGADLVMHTTAPLNTFQPTPGTNYSYTLNVSNNGPHDTSTNLTVTNTLPPAGVTFVSASGTGWTCNQAVGTVTCTSSTALASGATSTDITITVNPTATSGSILQNTATISLAAGTSADATDPVSGNNTSTLNLTVGQGSDLALPAPTFAGGYYPSVTRGGVTYNGSEAQVLSQGEVATLTVIPRFNGGTFPTNASTQRLTITLNKNKWSSVGTFTSSPSFWSCSYATQANPSTVGTITCNHTGAINAIGVLPTITFNATASTSTTSDTLIANIDFPSGDPMSDQTQSNNNSSLVINFTTPVPDIGIRKDRITPTGGVAVGNTVVFELQVRNYNTTATGGKIQVTDTLPPELRAAPANVSCANGRAGSSGWSLLSYNQGTGVVVCERSSGLGNNVTQYVNITTQAMVQTNGVHVDNTASVACVTGDTSCVAEVNMANNTTALSQNIPSTTFPIDPGVDLSITKSPHAVTVKQGQPVTYTITVTNNSATDTAQNVRVRDDITSAYIGTPTATWSNGVNSGSCNDTGHQINTATSTTTQSFIRCNVGSLAPGASATVTVVAAWFRSANFGATCESSDFNSNTATVSSDAGDNNTANNTGTGCVNVTEASDLQASISSNSASAYVAGAPITYTLGVTNHGAGTASGVTLTTTEIPADMEWLNDATSGCAFSVTPGPNYRKVICSVANPMTYRVLSDPNNPNSAPTSTYKTALERTNSFTFRVRPRTGNVSRTISVASNGTGSGTGAFDDPVSGNNTASVTDAIQPASLDMLVNDTDDVDPQAPGNPVVHTVRITNSGPSLATNVTATNTPPVGPTVNSVSAITIYSNTTACSGSTVAVVNGTGVCTGGSPISCDIGELDAGHSACYTLSLTSNVPGIFTNQVDVSSTETLAGRDTDSANNSVTQNTTYALSNSILGKVYLDANNNGAVNTGENGINGVTVQLSGYLFGLDGQDDGGAGNDDDTAFAGATTTTDANGDFLFSALSPGKYTITEPTQPTGTNNGITSCTTGGCAVTAVAVTPSVISGIVINGGVSTGNNFGELPPPTVSKSFNPTTINSGGTSTLTITLTNSGTGIATLDSIFTDTLPAGVVVAGTPNVGGTCSGTKSATAGQSTVTYASGATIPASGSCTITVDVTSSTTGTHTNTISVGALSTNYGVNPSPATANLTVGSLGTISGRVFLDQDNDGSFNGANTGIQNVTVELYLHNGTNYPGTATATTTTDVNGNYSFTGLAAGTYRVLEPTQPSGTNNGITTAGSISGTGTAGSSTAVSLTPSAVSDIVLGTALGVVGSSSGNNFAEVPPPSVAKAFNPTSITSGGTSTLTITLTNSGSSVATLSSVFTDTLPAGVVIAATPNVGGTCSGTKSATAGQSTVTYASGATIPASGSCTITVDVTSSTVATHTNTISAGALVTDYGVNPNPATATLTVTSGSNGSISGRVFLDLGNDGSFGGSDTGLSGVTVELYLHNGTAYPGTATATTTTDGSGNYSFTGLAAGTYRVLEPTQPTGTSNGITTAGAITGAGTAGTATAVNVTPSAISDIILGTSGSVATTSGNNFAELPPPSVSKAFSPTAITSGGVSTLTITLTNNGSSVATLSADFTDTLPAGVVVAATPNVGGTCSGTKTAAAAGSTVTYASGATIPASSSCTITVDVTSSTLATHTNTINAGALSTNYGVNPNPATATLTVGSQGAISGRVFLDQDNDGNFNGANSGIQGVTVELYLHNGTAYPGTATATTTTDANGNYSFTGLATGTYRVLEPTQPTGTNNGITTAGSITGTGTAGTATTVSVTPSAVTDIILGVSSGTIGTSAGNNFAEVPPPGVSKSFTPASISTGSTSTLTITLSNSGSSVATLIAAFTDTLPANVVVAATPNVGGTCTGAVTAAAGSGSVTYASGATIPASGSCTITVDVTSSVAGTYTNTINPGGLQTNYGVNPNPGTSVLTVYTLGQINGRVFLDQDNDGQFNGANTGISGVTVELYRHNGTAYPGVATATTTTDGNGNYSFSNLSAGMYRVQEPTQPTGTNNGITTAGAISGTGTAGTAAAVAVTPSVVTDIILTLTGTATGSSLGNNFAEVPPPSVTKAFNPSSISTGSTSTLTITLTNNGSSVATLIAPFVDTLPAGVTVAATPNIGGTCTGTVTAAASGSTVAYATGATIPASGSCTITVDVTSNTAGNHVNTINPGGLQTNYGVNPTPGTSILNVFTLGSISGKVFVDVANNGTFDDGADTPRAGETIQLFKQSSGSYPGTPTATTTTDASGNYSFSNLSAGTFKVVQPNQPTGTSNGITTAGSITGTGTVGTATVVTVTPSAVNDIVLTLTGTATGSSPGNNFAELPPPGIGKAFSPANIIPGGESILTITLTNNGTATATLSADLVDTLPANVVVAATPSVGGTCSGTKTATASGSTVTYASGATIPAGSSCTITVAVTSATAGTYTNTIPAGGLQTNYGLNPTPATADLVVAQVGSLSGFVYNDADNDGIKDAGETGVGAAVTVTLSGLTSWGANVCTVLPSCTTSANATTGAFSFSNLPAGTYALTETQSDVPVIANNTPPMNYQDGKETAGTIGGLSNGTVDNSSFGSLAAQNRITGIVFPAAGVGGDYLFGERLREEQRLIPPVVRGYVWKRSTPTERKPPDGSGRGLGGWTVKLLQGGVVICTQSTADDGSYAFTNLSCHTPANNFGVTGFPTGAGYSIEFSSPSTSSLQINNAPISDNTGATKCRKGDTGCTVNTADAGAVISGLTLNNGDEITEQNLPIDPSGIVYRTDTGAGVPGVRVRFLAPGGAVVPNACMNGTPSDTTTDGTGFYQFLLIAGFNVCPGAGNGTYTIEVNTATVASGFHAGVSDSIVSCETLGSGALLVDNDPNPALTQHGLTGHTVQSHNAGHCPGSTDATFDGVNAAGATSRYYLTFNINSVNNPGNVVNNNIPIRPVTGAEITMTKTTPKITVQRGELVPYTLTATSTVNLTGIDVVDQVPPGFKYKTGSAYRRDTANGAFAAAEPTVNGRTLTWPSLNFTAGAANTKTFKMMLIPGAGVGVGSYVNLTWAALTSNSTTVSNVASATVRIVPDPVFDCSDLIGKVFDDKNVNGYQDEGEAGIPNVRLATATGLLVTTDAEGRYHVTCAAIPQMDRGSNFFMKLDERTLPSGYRVTTENPREVRVTRGKMTKLNFGAGIHRVIRLELTDEAFLSGSEKPGEALMAALVKMPETLKKGPSVLRLAYKKGEAADDLVRARLKQVRLDLESRWKELNCCYTLVFEEEVFTRASRAKGGAK